MKIKWKLVLIAGIGAEALLLVIRIPITLYIVPTPTYIGVILWFVPMFLGGLWVAQKIESQFIRHGVLVGVIANIVFFPMALLFEKIQPATTTEQSEPISNLLMFIVFIAAISVKIFGSSIGSYVGGKMSKNVHEKTSN